MNRRTVHLAEELAGEFAARTGLFAGGNPARRYLWTDAFAVLTFLELWRQTGSARYRNWALRLVDAVHHHLGTHRSDDPRSGWISGLSHAEGEARPTAGGLRIGKPWPERRPEEPYHEQLEWERDGQYFHYLTRWMAALCAVSTATGEPQYLRWSTELALAARRAFVYQPTRAGAPRMWWKLSVDLSRPAVPGMGQIDPLDGLVTLGRIQDAWPQPHPELTEPIEVMREMCDSIDTWATTDTLGIGGLLGATEGLARLIASGHGGLEDLLFRVAADAEQSLRALGAEGTLTAPVESRLAFRELGLTIGLQSLAPTLEIIRLHPDRFSDAGPTAMAERVARLMEYLPLVEMLHRDWLRPSAQHCPAWVAHLDINAVTLAASLVAAGTSSSAGPAREPDGGREGWVRPQEPVR